MVDAPLGVADGLKEPQGDGVHVQVTPPFCGSFVTVAVNACVEPEVTVAVLGATETVTAGTVIVAEDDLLGSACDVAVIVTVSVLDGGVVGAV